MTSAPSGSPPSILGVILAGGSSRRFGSDKGSALLNGVPLLQHAILRAAGQVDALALSVGAETGVYDRFGLALLPDADPGEGPLAGILAALDHAEANGFERMAAFPCDTPFFPPDIVSRLLAGLDPEQSDYAVAASPTGEHRAFSLWISAARRPLARAFAAGLRRFEDVEAHLRKRAVAFPEADADAAPGGDPFFNINRREDLALAEAWLATTAKATP